MSTSNERGDLGQRPEDPMSRLAAAVVEELYHPLLTLRSLYELQNQGVRNAADDRDVTIAQIERSITLLDELRLVCDVAISKQQLSLEPLMAEWVVGEVSSVVNKEVRALGLTVEVKNQHHHTRLVLAHRSAAITALKSVAHVVVNSVPKGQRHTLQSELSFFAERRGKRIKIGLDMPKILAPVYSVGDIDRIGKVSNVDSLMGDGPRSGLLIASILARAQGGGLFSECYSAGTRARLGLWLPASHQLALFDSEPGGRC